MTRLPFFCLVPGLFAAASLRASDAPLTFNRDVRPILADACFHCHGPDSVKREADLRLDTEAGFFGKDGGADAVVIPGKPEESSLYDRLITEDADDLMPPPDSHKDLKPAQIEIVRRWIAEGAKWQPHWSFLRPEKPTAPSVSKPEWAVHPMDRFILARLDEAGLTPAPEADRRSLARRVALDLTGLPPTPEEVEAFVADTDPQAYERLIDRYLASPRWGEHRGRYWLDAARYADTHGYHFDNYREMWPYRDWVIGAFNQNERFDQFTIEQIAGDLLPAPTENQLIATGFQRCNMTTNEGGTIDEENLALYATDRVQTMGWVYLGLTLNCAQCHDHKFDPLTMRDYYAMAAFFRNTTQKPKDGNVKDSGPVLVVPAATDRPRWAALPGEIAAATARREQRRNAARPEFETWLAAARPKDIEEGLGSDRLAVHVPLSGDKGGTLSMRIPAGRKGKAPDSLAWAPGGKFGPAPVWRKDATADLGDLGNFARNEAFSVAVWIRPAKDGMTAAAVARMDVAANHRGWDLFIEGRNLAFHLIDSWPDNALKVGTQQPVLNPEKWSHVVVSYDGGGKAAGVKIHVDGKEVPTRVLADTLKPDAETRSNTPLRVGQRSSGLVFEGGQVQDLRIFTRSLGTSEAEGLRQIPALHAALSAGSKRTPQQAETLFGHFLTFRDAAWRELDRSVAKLAEERESIRTRSPVTHIQEERKDQPAMANILARGAYDQVGEAVAAAPPAVLHRMPAGAPANRMGLARWLVDPANPLTARVTVNRFWQEIFGTGLVATSEDFGIMGATPSHPELLDWLALNFIESGWDVKALL